MSELIYEGKSEIITFKCIRCGEPITNYLIQCPECKGSKGNISLMMIFSKCKECICFGYSRTQEIKIWCDNCNKGD